MSDLANAYLKLAIPVIRMVESPEDLREWWRDEQERREKYGVTGAYERRLVEACRHHMAVLEEKAKLPKQVIAPPRAKRYT